MTHGFKRSYIFRVSNHGCQRFIVFLTNFNIVGGEINFGHISVDNGVKKRKIAIIFTRVTHIWVTRLMVVKLCGIGRTLSYYYFFYFEHADELERA